MKKTLLLCGLLALTFATASAQAPDWYDAKNRMTFYPTNVYFSGFAMNEVAKGADLDKAIESVKAAARVEAVSTIQVHVQSVKKDFSRSDSYSNGKKDLEEFYQRFESSTKLSTDIDIPGLKIESYRDGNIVAAFAYVKKRDLQRQLEKQITMGLTRLETQMDNIDELIKNGQKAEARERLKPLMQDFDAIEKNQELLLTVDPEADAESLQLNEAKALQQRHVKMTAALKNGIYICILCTAKLPDGSNYPALLNEIKGNLSQFGCSFTEKQEEADWIINADVTSREYNTVNYGQSANYFTYVEAVISIKKGATGQIIYEDQVSVKGGHTRNYTEAARDGYKNMAPKLSEIIKQQIQQ